MPAKSYEFLVDGSPYQVPTDELVGVQVRALAGIAPEFDLILEGEGAGPDRLIGDDDRISLRDAPARLFSRPPTAMGYGEIC